MPLAMPGRPGTTSAEVPVLKPRLVLAATILASSLSFIDGSVVNVGLPAIGRELGDSAAGLQWIVDAYLLPLSALVLFGGALGDRYGRRRLLVLGVAIFAAASAACAGAPSLGALAAARVMQGIGAALLMPNSLAVLGDAFEGDARGKAIGTWAAFGAATSGLGPVLGGWLIDLAGWRMIFIVNLPLAVAAIALVRWSMPDERGSSKPAPLDLGGVALATGGLGAVTTGLILGSGPAGWSVGAVSAVAAGVAGLVLFTVWERHRGERAMMPVSLFTTWRFAGLQLFTVLLYGAMGALVVLLPYAMMRAGHATAAQAGAALLPLTVSLAILSRAMGGLAARVGAAPLLAAGAMAVAVGFVLMTRAELGGSYWTDLFPALLTMAIGMAAAVAPLTTAVLSCVDGRHTGSASGLNTAVARTGGLIATACLGGALSAEGAALVAASHAAALVSAVVAVLAALCAVSLVVERRAGARSGRPVR